MRLVAIKDFIYADKALKAGDAFDAGDEDARLLKGFGKAEDAPKSKRTYQRRDMVAES